MTLALTPEKRAHLARIGRLGGLTAAMTVDTEARARRGQSKFREGFNNGHSCTLCPQTTFPAGLSDREKNRRGAILYRLHFIRLAQARR